MKITFLGTNGWFDTETGMTPCIHVETNNEHIVLDAGNGFFRLAERINDRRPVYLFLSHFHFDHTAGLLHDLNLLDLPQGIKVYGPKGIKKYIASLIRSPYTMPLSKLRTRVAFHDLAAGSVPPFPVEFLKLKHPSLCYGYRFTLEGKFLAYCTDTGWCENILRLARGADLLISECSFTSGQTSEKWGHLNPELAAQAAKDAGAKRLVLTHFDAALYLRKTDRSAAQKSARRIFPASTAAFDCSAIML